MADSIKTPSKTQEDPGQIVTKKTLTLHTKEALKIFYGRKADQENGIREIPGLPIYATLLRNIWAACLSADPYARWWIQKLEMRLNEAEAYLKHVNEEIDLISAKVTKRIDLSSSEATSPVTVSLNYASPYMFMIVYRLIEVDELVAKMINLRHMAIIPPSQFDHYKKHIVGTINRILLSLRGYKNTGVTDIDINESNAKAKEAIEAMGQLPEKVLSGEYVPVHMPTKTVRVFGFNKPKQSSS